MCQILTKFHCFIESPSVVIAVEVTTLASADPDQKCDKLFLQMVDGCKSVRQTILNMTTTISTKSLNDLCCALFRYNICVRSIKTVAAVPKATRICPEKFYDSLIDELDSNNSDGLEQIKFRCDTFDSQTCITEPVGNALNEVKNRFNDAISVLGGLAESIRKAAIRNNNTNTQQ